MSLWQDFRFAVRLLVKDRWVTVMAVVTLGLGIGATNTMFTCVNAVLVRGLPYPHGDRIMHLNSRNVATGDEDAISYPDFQDMRAASRTFETLAAFQTGTMNVSDDRRAPERLSGAWVTANTFKALTEQTRLGRDFRPDEDRPGAEPVVILGYGIWADRYGSDPNILGRTIRINEIPATVIGVMREGVKFPMNADLWQPLVPTGERERRQARSLSVFGAVRPGVRLPQAQAEMSVIAAGLATQYPDTNKDIGVLLLPYNDRFNGGPIKVVFSALMGAVGFVLLIACANVANLLLVRSAGRSREIALRAAVGASRWRIVRHLLVESLILAVLAGLLGLALSIAGVRLFDCAVVDVGKPYWIQFTMDLPVFAFLVLVSLGGAGLMMRSFLTLCRMDFGIRSDRVLTVALMLAERSYPKAPDWVAFHDRLSERLTSTPGALSTSVASALPLGGGASYGVQVEGRPDDGTERPRATVVSVGPRYFETLDLAPVRGREFADADGREGTEAAIMNARFVEQMMPGQDPIGKRIRLQQDQPGQDRREEPPWLTIIGLAPAVRQRSVQDAAMDPVVYVPFRQSPTRFAFLLARGRGDAAALAPLLREEVRRVHPDQPVYRVNTLAEVLARARWPYRVFGGLFVVFAFIALVVSAVGIYAVTAYSVTQRRQEIGVRMALGAGNRQLTWLVLRRATVQLAIGLGAGLGAALGLNRVLQSLLVQSTANDPLTYVAVAAVFAVVTIVASVVPSRRATRLDPLTVLRAE